MDVTLAGSTAAEIAESARELIERGILRPGDALPPVRAVAEQVGVNRNTAVAAYRALAQAGLVVSLGRAGTRVAGETGVAVDGLSDTRLRDVGTGNPDAGRIPDPSRALAAQAGRAVLYGEPALDPDLEAWARTWIEPDLAPPHVHLTVTGGAVDAVERLLAQALTRDDAVALEDPCFLASIHTVRLGGYRAVPVPVDAAGMTVDGLRAALDAGVRAIVLTPRAQNPTGASLTAERAAALRELLADHPYVLVIEDDHFSMLSTREHHSVIGPEHRRYALVRSVSKFYGPDMCLAVVASDATTAERLALRLRPGTTWVSHILQRLTHSFATDIGVQSAVAEASGHYAEQNARFAERLTSAGIPTSTCDGLSLWVDLGVPARSAAEQLMRHGWLVRTGDDFSLSDVPSTRLRLTVHDLTDAEATALVADIAAVVDAVRGQPPTAPIG